METLAVRRPWLEPVLLAFPGVALGLAGLLHPAHLNPDTAFRWYALHVPGMLVFPLVGAAIAWVVRGERGPAAWVVRVMAYGYAVFYSALDVISGVAAGFVTDRLGQDAVPRPAAIAQLFRIGSPLGDIGSGCLLVAVAALGVIVVRRDRRGLLPWVALLVGAYLLREHHIFPGWGTAACVLIGLGTAGVGLEVRRAGRDRSHADAGAGA